MLGWKVPGALVAVHTEAALAGDPDQTWVQAGRRCWRQLVVAERSAANGPVDAGTLMFTAGMEALAILVNPAVVLTCPSLRFSSTDAPGHGHVVAVITL